MTEKFKIEFLEEVLGFLEGLDEKARNKIFFNIDRAKVKTDNRVTIVIATHGIIKKTQKTPKKEIDKATELMNKYFESKNKK